MAPHLLREWIRALRLRDFGYYANGLAISLIAIIIVAQLAGMALASIVWLIVHDRNVVLHAVQRPSVGIAVFLLTWDMILGVLGGWITAAVVRRAPFQASVILATGLWIFAVLAPRHSSILAPWQYFANATSIFAGVFAGGLLRTMRRGASEPEVA